MSVEDSPVGDGRMNDIYVTRLILDVPWVNCLTWSKPQHCPDQWQNCKTTLLPHSALASLSLRTLNLSALTTSTSLGSSCTIKSQPQPNTSIAPQLNHHTSTHTSTLLSAPQQPPWFYTKSHLLSRFLYHQSPQHCQPIPIFISVPYLNNIQEFHFLHNFILAHCRSTKS